MLIHTIFLSAVLMVIYGFPVQDYADEDMVEISAKLVRLKELLEKLDIHRNAEETGMSTSTQHVTEEKKSRDKLTSSGRDKPYSVTDGDTSDIKQMKTKQMKHVIDSLNEDDLNKLKLLRNLAGIDISSSRAHKDDSGTDNEQSTSLHQQLNAIIQEEKKPGHIPAVTMKGKFLPSREEIKYAVEKNLMSDMALAIHSGISIQDLLKDLIGQTQDSKMAAVTSQGEWLDTYE